MDSDTFRKDPKMAEMYNKTLDEEREIAKEVAQKEGCAFADVYGTMWDAMVKAKAKYGAKYARRRAGTACTRIGTGNLCMAYAFLKGLGVDGNIGTITVDLAGNKAEGTRRAQGAGREGRRGGSREHAGIRSASTGIRRARTRRRGCIEFCRSTRT